MIRRTLLATLLSAALAAAATPGIDRARVRRANGGIETAVDRLEAAARSVAADEAVPEGRPGARRVVEIELPGGGWDEAEIDAARLDARSERTLLFSYRIGGGKRRVRRISTPVAITTDGDTPVELDGAGPHEIALSLHEDERRRIVVERIASER
ncbi:hypothetical protein SAMN06269185_1999 [Natronoarchaeum philippinense]|uniref:DUF7311 domain-containing protein n=1 Tax=Natronoarchaeum philippinense TaxID=558529 RepID=A0A285NU26_NATPI|nr:hypothetical protein [Natronoarchaeum philippinense]SNZ12970.1 hypothetical protein SAMN06269185_1999 [Natronoarchaeum philippinense]